jgi:uncharacterized membrane protein required for colicin V production
MCGFVIVFFSVQMGMKAGGLLALGGALSTTLGMLVALRYWFLASQWIGQRESTWTAWHSVVVFWVIFFLVVFLSSRFRQNYTEVFESVLPSFVDRVLGGAFGLVTGAVVATALVMTFSIAGPAFLPAYQRDQLPLPLDGWPLQAYRVIETRLAGVGAKERGHTLLPTLNDKDSDTPVHFWR